MAGAHAMQYLRRPRLDELHYFDPNFIRIMTVAPELPEIIPVIQALTAQNVCVGLSHSVASYDQTKAAMEAGARFGAHVFNAMGSLHHRYPGIVGALLAEPGLAVSLIADGVHIHPALLNVVVQAKGPQRVCLISDGAAAAGLGEGEYYLGEQKVTAAGHTLAPAPAAAAAPAAATSPATAAATAPAAAAAAAATAPAAAAATSPAASQEKPSNRAKTVETLADKFQGGATLHESLHTKVSKEEDTLANAKPVTDLLSAIGINDRYTFIRELFNGDSGKFESAIKFLNDATSFNDAYNYMLLYFNWDMESEPVQLLLDMIRRKFIKHKHE
ncbi:MAG: hypothetical protein R6X09_09630 [Bacteroidales bacterium]